MANAQEQIWNSKGVLRSHERIDNTIDKKKLTKLQTMVHKTLHSQDKILSNTNSTKTMGWIGRIFCPIRGSHHVAYVKNIVISYERELKDGIVIMTKLTRGHLWHRKDLWPSELKLQPYNFDVVLKYTWWWPFLIRSTKKT